MKKTRIMYMENKETNEAIIGKVKFSKTGKTIYYKDKTFCRGGILGNYYDEETNEDYWISGCKKDGSDRLFGNRPVKIDEDVKEEYNEIRK